MKCFRLYADQKGRTQPKKQFLICMQGQLEVAASDGEKHTFGPGDRVLMEDVDGERHRSRVKGADEFVAAVVPVE